MRRDSTTSLAVVALPDASHSRAVDLRGSLMLAAILAYVVPRCVALYSSTTAGLEPPMRAALGTLLALALAARLTRCVHGGVARGLGSGGAARGP